MLLEEKFRGRTLTLRARRVGEDLTVLCAGGDRPHLGGCALAAPYDRGGRPAAAVSSLAAPGHQDAVLAAAMAGRLCKRLRCTVAVQCGIHYDRLTADELQRLQETVLAMCDRVEAME